MTNEYFFFLDGETPSKKNSRITLKSRKSIPNKKYRDWNKSAVCELKRQWVAQNANPKPIERCEIEMHFVHADKRRRDSDNATSSVFDTLKDAGIIVDDNWTVIPHYNVQNYLNYKKEQAHCRIKITVRA